VPAPAPSLGDGEVERILARECFAPTAHRRVGVELEWLVVSRDQPSRPVPFPLLRAAIDAVQPLPCGGVITYEPGGQLELSARPGPIADAIAATHDDAAVLRHALHGAGLATVGLGLDPVRRRDRVVDSARYAAMEAYFDRDGPAGRSMMCATAAVQINLDTGTSGEIDARWARAHGIGPVLLAAFANSPFVDGRPSGWRSSRWATWGEIDASRTAPAAAPGIGAGAAWHRYALDARVMLIRVDEARTEPVLEPMTFSEWMRDGHPFGFPTRDDLLYHLSTLFPPVRPRGRLELRMIDALPDPLWSVAVAVATALVDDAPAAAVADAALPAVRDRWGPAARDGLTDPALHAAAASCFASAIPALARLGATRATVAAVERYADTYVARRRTPADDRLDAWAAGGAVLAPEPAGSAAR
jgi:glutamate--cysteine ligase